MKIRMFAGWSRVSILSITIIGFCCVAACGESTPSISQAKVDLIQKFQNVNQGGKCLKVVSFEKTNAVVGEKIYKMEYKAQVEIIDPQCSGNYFQKSKFLSITDKKASDVHVSGYQNFKLGSIYEVVGTINFKKTENGWRYEPSPSDHNELYDARR